MLFCDIECFPNWFSIGVYNDSKKKYSLFETYDEVKVFLERVVQGNLQLVMQNSSKYDAIMLDYIYTQFENGVISDDSSLIKVAYGLNKDIFSDTEWHYGIRSSKKIPYIINHFDIFEFTNLSLKEAQCTSGYPILESMEIAGIHTNQNIDGDMLDTARGYLYNDVMSTYHVWCDTAFALPSWHEGKVALVDLALSMGISSKTPNKLWSLSNSRIVSEVMCRGGKKDKTPNLYKYHPPIELSFDNKDIQSAYDTLRNHEFRLNEPKRDKFKYVFETDGTTYSLMEGGLHGAIEGYKSTERHIDFDVDSYYPSMISAFEYYPSNFNISLYRQMIVDRLALKKSTDANDKLLAGAYKIILNGTYGKFGEEFSKIKSLQNMLNVCLTGQLLLFKLIDMCLEKGFHVVYANTDGITVKEDGREDELMGIFSEFSKLVGMTFETAVYTEMYILNVNNYIIKTDNGRLKVKGEFVANSSKRVGGYCRVVKEALLEYIDKGTPIDEYILSNNDIKSFTLYNKSNSQFNVVSAPTVKNGDTCDIGGEVTHVPSIYRWVIGRVKHTLGIFKDNTNAPDKKPEYIKDSKNYLDAIDLTTLSIKDVDKYSYIRRAEMELLNLTGHYRKNTKLSQFLGGN